MQKRASGRTVPRPLTERGLKGRRALKRFLYTQLALRQVVMIALGREQPLLNFTVEADPPSVYAVYRVRPERVDDLAGALGLPPELPPTPIRCLADDEPEYLVAANIYRVSGLATGMRIEWSAFVADEAGIPRYMVVDAMSSEFSMDPVDIITPRSVVEHSRTGNRITSFVDDGKGTWSLDVDLPEGDGAPRVSPAPEWATANDFIYWTNGICDRTWYDAGMHDPRKRRVPEGNYTTENRTHWAELLEDEPVHVLVFEDAIELTISPWENIDRIRP